MVINVNNDINKQKPHQHRPMSLRDIKRLPVDISKQALTDPVNIPSRLKLFQASSDSEGNGSLFGLLQYTFGNGLRVSARSLDNRVKLTHEVHRYSTPIKLWFASGDNTRGNNEIELGTSIPNLYSTYKTGSGSVIQLGCGIGLKLIDRNNCHTNYNNNNNKNNYNQHSSQDETLNIISRVRPFITPKFTYFGPLGWLHLQVPINRNGNLLDIKHHFFFNVRGNTFLSSLEYATSRIDRTLRSSKKLRPIFTSPNHPSDIKETIHYKIVHVASATELGLRRIRKIHGGSKWQVEFGLKHTIQSSVFIQCLFTHTIGDKTNFGLSFGLDL